MKINADIIRKYSLEEVALLAMFAFGLLLAGLIVVRRSHIGMSEPVQLPYSGLSLSLPAGPGWDESPGWSYAHAKGNEFNLSTGLRTGSQLGEVGVLCRYLLASPETDPEKLLTDRLTAVTLQEARSGQTVREVRSGRIVNDVIIHWVQIADTFLGVAALDHGRMLEIMVKAPADRSLAGKVFRQIAESVVFESDGFISRGADFIRRFRSRGLDDIIQRQNAADAESIYIIRDALDEPRGFQIETFRKNTERSDWSSIVAERIHYTVGTRGQAGKSHFECTDRLDRFIWQNSRTSRRAPGATATEIELAADGSMHIRDARFSKELTYRPGDHAVAEILIGRLTGAFLDAYGKEVLVDLILADGTIRPAVISKVDVSRDARTKWNAEYAVRLRLVLGGDAYVQTYFDRDKNLVGKIEKDRGVLYWHKSDRKTLAETFDNLERYLSPPRLGR